jgi:monofunctional biosynthetic peptidoglycan transglycosylase
VKARPFSPKVGFRRAVAILVLLLFCGPAAQVIRMRWVNPQTTMPAVLRSLGKNRPVAKFRWLDWKGVPVDVREALLIGEDTTFFEHGGFDFRTIWDNLAYAWRSGKAPQGASTITQQCARSLFLWQGHSWVRKTLEAYYTVWMSAFLSKQRILELYANVIEFGDGVFGIEAGAQYHFGLRARQLSREQIAGLIAIMPNPRALDPNHLFGRSKNRAEMILNQINQIDGTSSL